MSERLTDDEVMAALRSDTPLNRARAQFRYGCARLEQEGMQRRVPGPIEFRRMEFEITQKIIDAFLSSSVAEPTA